METCASSILSSAPVRAFPAKEVTRDLDLHSVVVAKFVVVVVIMVVVVIVNVKAPAMIAMIVALRDMAENATEVALDLHPEMMAMIVRADVILAKCLMITIVIIVAVVASEIGTTYKTHHTENARRVIVTAQGKGRSSRARTRDIARETRMMTTICVTVAIS